MKYAVKLRRLCECVGVVQGVNSTRIEKQMVIKNEDYYDQNAFDYDFKGERELEVESGINDLYGEFSLEEGDVVINNRLQLAAIVSRRNSGKVNSLNFTKVTFNGGLDKKYFIYIFNEHKDVKRQKNREAQGTGMLSAAPRLSIKALGELVIPVPPLEEQEKIGEVYFESLKLKNKLNRYGQLIEKLTTGLLEERLQGM